VAALVTAAGAVGLALQIRDGNYEPSAMALVAVALLCSLGAVVGLPRWGPDGRNATTPGRQKAGRPRVRIPVPSPLPAPSMASSRPGVSPTEGHEGLPGARLGGGTVQVLVGVLLAAQGALLLTHPAAYAMLDQSPGSRLFFRSLIAAALAVLAVIALAPPGAAASRRWLIPVLLALHFAAGVWILRHAPPGTDVFNFQRGALEALRHGRDPYAIRFRNIYHPFEGFYPPGTVVRGILQFGYPYPPLPLLLSALALPFGDIRYAHLAALTLGGGALCYARPGPLAPLAAGLLLLSPRFGLVLQMSWTEPFCILFLGLVVLCALRAPRLLPLALGLLLASKQYLVLAAPAAYLLVAGDSRGERLRRTARLLAVAGGVALAVSLPFIVWDARAFVRSAVALHLHARFRPDSLSFLVSLARAGAPPLHFVSWLLAPAALAVALWRAPCTPAGFSAAVALVFLVLFAFGKQAFCNYYFFVLGALCAAIASADLSGAAGAQHLLHYPGGAGGADPGAGTGPSAEESVHDGLDERLLDVRRVRDDE
jgi:hypothetical protein